MFLEDMGLKESGVARLIKAAYRLLNLETFFTTGADETRAWTYARGMKAPQTAGIIQVRRLCGSGLRKGLPRRRQDRHRGQGVRRSGR